MNDLPFYFGMVIIFSIAGFGGIISGVVFDNDIWLFVGIISFMTIPLIQILYHHSRNEYVKESTK